MSQIPKPTEAELDILNILWESGPATVRVINEKQNEHRPVGYTTTLKIMQVMTDKGMLEREPGSGRSHVYKAAFRQQETQKVLLDRFMETAFGGSAMKLVMQALGNRKTSSDELKQIRDYLDRIEGDKA